MKQKVTAYIPCHNAESYLSRSIEGVLRQTHEVDELLVIDDGSRDSTLEIAARYPARVIRHDRNRGLAAVRNTGFRNARNELVAALDADCVPEPDWLEKLVSRFDSEAVAAVGGRLKETMQDSVADRWRRAHMPQDWGDTALLNPRFLFGSNLLLRKSVVERVEGYAESFRTNGEDVDISQRIRAQGFSLVYEPGAVVKHLRQDTVRTVLDAYWRWWKFGVRAYSNGIRLRSVLGHMVKVHFGTTFLGLVRCDLSSKQYELLWLDALALLYMSYRDFKLFLDATWGPPRSKFSGEA